MIQALGYRGQVSGFRVYGFRVQGFGCSRGSGFKVRGVGVEG